MIGLENRIPEEEPFKYSGQISLTLNLILLKRYDILAILINNLIGITLKIK